MGGKGGRPDISHVILFLCTRVTMNTKEEKEKLSQVLQYLKHTIYDKRIMGEKRLIQLCTCFEPHMEYTMILKSHTGGCISFGYWVVHCKSSKKTKHKKFHQGQSSWCKSLRTIQHLGLFIHGSTRI